MSGGSGQQVEPVIVIHGGAWAIPESLAEASVAGVKQAARAGHALLRQGGSAVDAVERAVTVLEDDPAFDAGTGSVLNAAGEVEMDAVVMDGGTLRAGGVACVSNIQHPVHLARLVMDKTDHALLVGKGANQFAGQMGVPTVAMETLVTETARAEWQRYMQYRETVQDLFSNRAGLSGCDTVGAVAVDVTGNVAFATSTGGITAKRPGRVGDSPIVGAGGYADSQVGAVSSTGHGEAIIRTCLAHRIITLMETGQSPDAASRTALDHMTRRVQGSGGVVVVSAGGEVGVNFTTQRMAWAWVKDGQVHSGLDAGQHDLEPL
ncbi:isoaspartyl peptidase/L-asparaginase-like [Babylonia areolata]|uniref:isoaspartyl peptidase/L-asparaginase-like n=1 Tax=Babylonia areolata TaxID=304850 RepID=UPI003FD22F6E